MSNKEKNLSLIRSILRQQKPAVGAIIPALEILNQAGISRSSDVRVLVLSHFLLMLSGDLIELKNILSGAQKKNFQAMMQGQGNDLLTVRQAKAVIALAEYLYQGGKSSVMPRDLKGFELNALTALNQLDAKSKLALVCRELWLALELSHRERIK